MEARLTGLNDLFEVLLNLLRKCRFECLDHFDARAIGGFSHKAGIEPIEARATHQSNRRPRRFRA